jgi:hypothetical protein
MTIKFCNRAGANEYTPHAPSSSFFPQKPLKVFCGVVGVFPVFWKCYLIFLSCLVSECYEMLLEHANPVQINITVELLACWEPGAPSGSTALCPMVW